MTDPTKPLKALLKKLEAKFEPAADAPPCPDHADRVVHELIYSLLLWEAGPVKARAAIDRIDQAVVDYNELRICMTDELIVILGPRYPLVVERAARLHDCLNEVYVRENGLTLSSLAARSKRDARTYLDSLPGMPTFATARICLQALGAHAFPLDSRLAKRLVREGVLGDGDCVDTAASKIERIFRAGEALPAYGRIESWAELTPARAPTKPAGRSATTKPTASRTTKASTRASTRR